METERERGEGGRKGEREREREREREKQTDRQTDRQRQTDRDKERRINRDRERQRETETERQRERLACMIQHGTRPWTTQGTKRLWPYVSRNNFCARKSVIERGLLGQLPCLQLPLWSEERGRTRSDKYNCRKEAVAIDV